jgi:hypothetical protein
MNRVKIAAYLVILALAYCEEEEIPVIPLLYLAWMRFWYGIAEFAGAQGIKAENAYWKAVRAD